MEKRLKLLKQFAKTTNISTSSGTIGNMEIDFLKSEVRRDGLRAVDSGVFICPSTRQIGVGDIFKYIQDDADTTYLRGAYLFQRRVIDESGYDMDEDFSSLIYENTLFGKFKNFSKVKATSSYCTLINRKYTDLISNQDSAYIHDFSGDFDIFVWVSGGAPNSVTLYEKRSGVNGAGVSLKINNGKARAELRNTTNNFLNLTTNNKLLNTEVEVVTGTSHPKYQNLIRLRRIGSTVDLFLINGTESSLFDTPDASGTLSGSLVSIVQPIIGKSVNTFDANTGKVLTTTGTFGHAIHSLRIYCGGTLDSDSAFNVFSARPPPLIMKLAGRAWKIEQDIDSKKLFVKGFGKIIIESQINSELMDNTTVVTSNGVEGESYGSNASRSFNSFISCTAREIIQAILAKINYRDLSNSGDITTFAQNQFKVIDTTGTDVKINTYLAEGGFVEIINQLITHKNASFFISSRGICLIEEKNKDFSNSISFKHGIYKIQNDGVDDTSTVNDLILYGKIPIKQHVSSTTTATNPANVSLANVLGSSLPLSIKLQRGTTWITTDKYSFNESTKVLQINDQAGTYNIIFEFEFIDTTPNGNLIRTSDTTSIQKIGRYSKRLYVPQMTDGAAMTIFKDNLLNSNKNIIRRFRVEAPYLINFVRENFLIKIYNDVKLDYNPNTNTHDVIDLPVTIKSVTWKYPEGRTIIECGEHDFDGFDLERFSSESIQGIYSTTFKNSSPRSAV